MTYHGAYKNHENIEQKNTEEIKGIEVDTLSSVTLVVVAFAIH